MFTGAACCMRTQDQVGRKALQHFDSQRLCTEGSRLPSLKAILVPTKFKTGLGPH
jgi:hypothetical protein